MLRSGSAPTSTIGGGPVDPSSCGRRAEATASLLRHRLRVQRAGEQHRVVSAIAERLRGRGVAAFLIDVTGHGDSEGSIEEATIGLLRLRRDMSEVRAHLSITMPLESRLRPAALAVMRVHRVLKVLSAEGMMVADREEHGLRLVHEDRQRGGLGGFSQQQGREAGPAREAPEPRHGHGGMEGPERALGLSHQHQALAGRRRLRVHPRSSDRSRALQGLVLRLLRVRSRIRERLLEALLEPEAVIDGPARQVQRELPLGVREEQCSAPVHRGSSPERVARTIAGPGGRRNSPSSPLVRDGGTFGLRIAVARGWSKIRRGAVLRGGRILEAVVRFRGDVMYRDRVEAGRALAGLLEEYRERHPLVLGIPRGGVPVAAEVARALNADLDIVVARKLGAPSQPELAIGAVTANGGRYLNDAILRELEVSPGYLEAEIERKLAESRDREAHMRGGRAKIPIAGRLVIVVDDGLATGATIRAAMRAVRRADPQYLVAAVPVGAPASCADLAAEVDRLVCPAQPESFYAVGQFYDHFEPTTEDEVRELLAAFDLAANER